MPDIAIAYMRWIGLRALLHRGYWLVASIYLVADAHLSPFQLVFLGTAQGLIALISEVPAGVMADTLSRKWSLVVAQVLVGGSMVSTGLVTAFPALVATQVVWGVGWTFASGADVAWLTDELGQPDLAARALAASARWEQLGAASGLLGFGLLALISERGATMVVAGIAMVALGLYVAARFTERGFVPIQRQRWRHSAALLRRGGLLARRDREIALILAATVLVNGAAEAYGRLYPLHLIALGLPTRADPILWFTLLGIVAFILGALALRVVEARIAGIGVARRAYATACAVGALGLIALAGAPNALVGAVGVALVGGVALTVMRTVGAIWVNRRTTSDVRATVQSLLAQAEYLGEICCGIALGLLAQRTTLATAFLCASALLGCVALLVALHRPAQGHRLEPA